MACSRATDKTKGNTYEAGSPKKIPEALMPMLDDDPEALFYLYFEARGNWGSEMMEVTQSQKKTSTCKGKGRWVSESELINGACKGNTANAIKMKNHLLE